MHWSCFFDEIDRLQSFNRNYFFVNVQNVYDKQRKISNVLKGFEEKLKMTK